MVLYFYCLQKLCDSCISNMKELFQSLILPWRNLEMIVLRQFSYSLYVTIKNHEMTALQQFSYSLHVTLKNDRISAVFLLPWRNQEMTVLSSFPTPFLLLWRNHEMTSLQRLSYNLLRVSDYKNTQYKVSLSLHVHFVSAILCWIGSTSYVICILSSEKFIHNTQQ